ncbi:MAG: hypothetical protein JXR78_09335, partial [Victivallales bacterium]|nr:hypothetical protein [Victivallales bacterium]
MLFTPTPYRDMLNTKVMENYNYIRQYQIDPAASTGYKLKKGTHRLTLKGREPGSRLARIWIGKFGESPEKNSGQYIDLSLAHITAPISIKEGILIGGDKDGSAEFSFKLKEDDTYAFWGEACGPDAASNSFFMSIDGNPEIVWDIPTSKSLKPVWKEMKGRGLDYFSAWILPMSWGACSPHSTLKNNNELRKLALNLLKISIDGIGMRKVQPAQLWFLEDLEALRLWQRDLRSPQE